MCVPVFLLTSRVAVGRHSSRASQGRVPKNDFGNIDLYVPTMLPAGAAYIPRTYTSPLARVTIALT